MSFACRPNWAVGGVISPLAAMSVVDTELSPTDATGSISFNSDGSISYTGNGSSGPTAWYSPGAPPATYYIKFTLDSGNAWDAGLVSGTVYSLASTRTVTWTETGTGLKTASVTVRLYNDSGGTELLASGTLSVAVESSV